MKTINDINSMNSEINTIEKTTIPTTTDFDQFVSNNYSDPQLLPLDDYKNRINVQISDMVQKYGHPRNENYIAITDECYEAMRQDPKYERWVLSTIFKSISTQPQYGYNTFTCMKFGETREDFRSESIVTPTESEKRRLEEKFRQERAEKKAKLRKQKQKEWIEKKWRDEVFLRELNVLKQINHKMQMEERNKAIQMGEDYTYMDKDSSLQNAARRKVAAYESSFLITDSFDK